MIMDDYDLLEDTVYTNPTFSVVFDRRTRPHFIILEKVGGEHVDPKFSCMNDAQKQDLVKTAISALKCLQIEREIMSIHHGKWRKTAKLHVHIYVDVKRYLETYDSHKKHIRFRGENTEKIKLHWPELYKKMVQGYAEWEKSYVKKEVEKIENWKEQLRKEQLSEEQLKEEQLRDALITELKDKSTYTKFHRNYPKIGFFNSEPDSLDKLEQVLSVIEKFAEILCLQDEGEGCQVRLYLESSMYDTILKGIFHIICTYTYL
jgi:hypothetical protein